jgi:hypothetical protein
MNSMAPSALDIKLGQRPFGLLALALTAYTAWRWGTAADHHEVFPGIVPLLGLALCIRCRKARLRCAAHAPWSQKWDAMSQDVTADGTAPGDTGAASPRRPKAPGSAPRRIARRFVLVVFWMFLGLWVALLPDDPKTPWITLAFLGFGAWGAGVTLLGLGRRVAHRARALPASDRRTKAREFIVRVCLPIPRSSAPADLRALPPYARELLARSAATGSHTRPTPST